MFHNVIEELILLNIMMIKFIKQQSNQIQYILADRGKP